jgi:hypothetical protein
MAHGSPHEEAEHASHHAQDPFDKRVAMSMVVIAAILAMVKVLGHRTHNDTLAYRIESGVHHTQESDQWNFFQAKKMREVLARQDAKLLLHLSAPVKDGPAPTPGPLPDRDKRLKALTKDLTESNVDKPTATAEGILDSADKRYRKMVGERYLPAQAERIVDAEITADRYSAEGKAIVVGAKAKQKDAKHALEQSEHKHHQAFFFDLGELGVEMALVLSSVAILTKRPNYWFGGLLLGAAGLVGIALGFLAH